MALSGGEISEILESITDAFLALDTDGCFTYVNRQAERMIGLKRHDLLGQNVWDVFPHLKDSRMYTEYERAVRTQQPVEFEEFYAERKAWLEVRAYPNPDGMTIYYRDVTKRKRADEAQRALVAMVSHDLRNPLFLIKGTTELLRDQLAKLPNASGVAADLERVQRAASQMDRVIDELMDLAQLQAGHEIVLERRPTELVSLAQRAVEAHRHITDAHQITLQADVRELVGSWDERRLERVLGNLLTNAIKYSPDGQKIAVSITREDHGAVLSVTDEGIGIPADELPHVFDRFYRGQSVAGVIPGAGIGLAGARHTIELHGGRIEVHSSDGHGSTFTVHLPLA